MHAPDLVVRTDNVVHPTQLAPCGRGRSLDFATPFGKQDALPSPLRDPVSCLKHLRQNMS